MLARASRETIKKTIKSFEDDRLDAIAKKSLPWMRRRRKLEPYVSRNRVLPTLTEGEAKKFDRMYGGGLNHLPTPKKNKGLFHYMDFRSNRNG